MAAKLDRIEVRGIPDAKDADQFVLAAIKAALTGIGFHPGDQVEHRAIRDPPGFHQFADMTPIHADKMHGAID